MYSGLVNQKFEKSAKEVAKSEVKSEEPLLYRLVAWLFGWK